MLAALGVQSMGTFTMTDTERREKRKHQVERHRSLAQEITDPLAAGLLRDIVSELEADLLSEMKERRPTASDHGIEPAVLEFHGGHSYPKHGPLYAFLSPKRRPA
jgi:hypothetical protein